MHLCSSSVIGLLCVRHAEVLHHDGRSTFKTPTTAPRRFESLPHLAEEVEHGVADPDGLSRDADGIEDARGKDWYGGNLRFFRSGMRFFRSGMRRSLLPPL
jgi:hypothetical protein